MVAVDEGARDRAHSVALRATQEMFVAAEDLHHAEQGLEEGRSQNDDHQDLDTAAGADRPQDEVAEEGVTGNAYEFRDRRARRERQGQPGRRRRDAVPDEAGIYGVGPGREDVNESGRKGDDLEDGERGESPDQDLDEARQPPGAKEPAVPVVRIWRQAPGLRRNGARRTPGAGSHAPLGEGPPADVEQEEAHGRGLEGEYRPLLDRADGQGQEDEDRAQAPEDDMIDHAIPAR
jgi:hypothetical protein